MCPTTLYRLGGDLGPTIRGGAKLRDLAEYDVLDELLITDGALTGKYRALVVLQADHVEDVVLDRIAAWTKGGGTLVLVGDMPLKNVGGEQRLADRVVRVAKVEDLAGPLAALKGVDGKFDGLMTCRRGQQAFVFNANDKATAVSIDLAGTSADIVVEPHTIWSNR